MISKGATAINNIIEDIIKVMLRKVLIPIFNFNSHSEYSKDRNFVNKVKKIDDIPIQQYN